MKRAKYKIKQEREKIKGEKRYGKSNRYRPWDNKFMRIGAGGRRTGRHS
jgi:hypothetical protein